MKHHNLLSEAGSGGTAVLDCPSDIDAYACEIVSEDIVVISGSITVSP